jgi:hypothetical protein
MMFPLGTIEVNGSYLLTVEHWYKKLVINGYRKTNKVVATCSTPLFQVSYTKFQPFNPKLLSNDIAPPLNVPMISRSSIIGYMKSTYHAHVANSTQISQLTSDAS